MKLLIEYKKVLSTGSSSALPQIVINNNSVSNDNRSVNIEAKEEEQRQLAEEKKSNLISSILGKNNAISI